MSQAFKPKSYFKPKTEVEASKLLEEYGERSRVIAGGTGIYEVAHRGLLSEVEALVDITDLNLSYVHRDKASLRIGACTTMAKLLDAQELLEEEKNHPGAISALEDALRLIQPLQVKNVATVAGAVCTALPFFDLPVALIALDVSVLIAPQGRREKLSEFILGYFATHLDSGEFVKEIQLPLPESDSEIIGSAFQKFALTGDDWALINCGVRVKLGSSARGGTLNCYKIYDARVCFGGGIGEKPRRVEAIEKLLTEVAADDENEIKSIFDANLAKELETVSDIRASSEYREHLAKVLGRRAILAASKRATSRA